MRNGRELTDRFATIFGMSRGLLWAGIPALVAVSGALATGAGVASASRLASTSCSTSGLAVPASGHSGYRVVKLRVQGIRCTKARSVALQVAEDLFHNRSVALSGISGIGISSMSCTGCTPSTQVSISYPDGQMTVSLRGGAGSSPGGPTPPPGGTSPGGGTII